MTPFDAFQQRKRFGNLDGLRFICISMVLWHHATPFDWTATQIEERGFLGVDFFFVLSGFLITTLLLREEKQRGHFSIRNFYWRRALRILPVYFFVVGSVGSYYIFVKGQNEYLDLWPFYFLFLSNFLTEHIPTLAPTWSLAVEEQYYLIWPLLLALCTRRLVIPLLTVLIAANIIGSLLLPVAPSQGPLFVLSLPTATYAPILMGSLLAILLNTRSAFDMINKALGHRYVPLYLFIILLVLMEIIPRDMRGWPNLAVHSVMTATLASILVREENVLSPFLTNRFIMRVGEISYGIYLYHLIALHITVVGLNAFGLASSWTILILYSAVSIVIAEISFRTLERFFQRFRPVEPFSGTNKPA